jgi:hypothetical protein
MFLTRLVKQNPQFVEAVIDLHQSGALPPDTLTFAGPDPQIPPPHVQEHR